MEDGKGGWIEERWGCLPSKACCTLLFKVCLFWEAEEGAPPEEGGFEARLITVLFERGGWVGLGLIQAGMRWGHEADAAMSYGLGGVRMGRGCHTIGAPSAPAIEDKDSHGFVGMLVSFFLAL